MIQLQRVTGMRPGEVVIIRSCDIGMKGDIWIYEPYEHKNDYRGHVRKIPFGPNAQELLKPFLNVKAADEFLFSPRDAEAHRNELRRDKRKSPMTPSQRKRKAKKKPKRAKRERYDTDSYRRAIKYGIKQVNRKREQDNIELIPSWLPCGCYRDHGRHRRWIVFHQACVETGSSMAGAAGFQRAGVRLLESQLFADEIQPGEIYGDVGQVTPNQATEEYRCFRQIVKKAEDLDVPHGYIVHRYGQTKPSLEVFGMDEYEALDQIRAYLANELSYEWSAHTS